MQVHDPLVDVQDVRRDMAISLNSKPSLQKAQCVVNHEFYDILNIKRYGAGCKPAPAKVVNHEFYDILNIKRYGAGCKPAPAKS